MTTPTPVTSAGLLGSMWARREEAQRALAFLAQVEALAISTRSLEPDGKVMAQAAEDARGQAIEAVLMWRTAVREMERLAEAEASRRRTG